MLLACTALILRAETLQPPLAHTGDFGQPSCNTSGCHVGNPVNATGGSLTITGVPAEYTPGSTYPITVTINRTNMRRWGFELTARVASGGAQAGSLVVTNSNFTQVDTEAGIQYMTHTFNGTYPGDAGPKTWTFNWVAPSTAVGAIRLSAAGNTANNNSQNTGDFIYTTTVTTNPQASNFITSLFYPRLVTTDGTAPGPDNSEYTGIAVANLDSVDATIRLTAFDKNGAQLSGSNITNPATRTLTRGTQLPIVDSQVFGPGLPAGNPVGWFKLESTVSKIVGFFLMFNGSLTFLDGADVSSKTITPFVFSEVQDVGFTQIHIANPNSESATINFDLVRSDGTTRASVQRTVNANGAVAEFFSTLFPAQTAVSSDSIHVVSSQPVVPFEFFGKTGEWVQGLNGQATSSGATTLYSPQYVVGGSDWRSTLSVLNLDSSAGIVTFEFIGDDGTPIAAPKQVNISGRGKIHISDQTFFLNAGGTLRQGYIKITSNGPRLAGSVVFGDQARNVFSSALPLISQLNTSMVFSQLATNSTYFTGLAIMNPGAAADVTVEVYDANGALIVSRVENIPAGQRKSQLLTEYFPTLVGQNHSSGYIKVTSSSGVATFALFGTQNLSVLSAVPPQIVP